MRPKETESPRRVLAIDVGGTHVKILVTGENEPRKFPSGMEMTPERMVAGVRELAGDGTYDAISIGYPGPVVGGAPAAEPHNLAHGWVGFDFEAAFGCPVKLINDAAMQALGSYKGGTMLFLGLGTGLGSALIANGTLVPMELGHLPYKKGTFEDYTGIRGAGEIRRGEVAPGRLERRGAAHVGPLPGRRRPRRRKREEAEGTPSRLPTRRQRERLSAGAFASGRAGRAGREGKGARHEARNDRGRADGGEHGSPADRRRPRLCRLRHVAEAVAGLVKEKAVGASSLADFREEAR